MPAPVTDSAPFFPLRRLPTLSWMYSARFLVLLALTAACSDDEPAAAEVYVSTGLPRDAMLSSFNDDDAKVACQALNNGAIELISDRELVRAQCASRAISASAKVNAEKTEVTLDLTKCAELTKSCQSDPVSYGVMAQGGREESDCSSASANEHIKQCEATVAEYEACISKLLDQAKRTLAKTECDNGGELLANDGAATKIDTKSVPECKAFLDKCPDIQITISVGN